MRLGRPQSGSCQARWRSRVSPAAMVAAVRRTWRYMMIDKIAKPSSAMAMNRSTLSTICAPGCLGTHAKRPIARPCPSARLHRYAPGTAGRGPALKIERRHQVGLDRVQPVWIDAATAEHAIDELIRRIGNEDKILVEQSLQPQPDPIVNPDRIEVHANVAHARLGGGDCLD